jgi:prepilin-type N-terminal cleavage/methylation domain-containing protein
MKRCRAFTLIELSIAVFIMAMVVAVALPSFFRSYNNAMLAEMVRTFSTTCQLARVEAVTRQRPAKLHVDLERQVFWVTQADATVDGEPGGEQTIKAVEMPARVRMVAAERGDAPNSTSKQLEVAFYPNGTCDSITVVFRGTERGALAAMLDPVTGTATPYPVK